MDNTTDLLNGKKHIEKILELLNTKYYKGKYNDGNLWEKISELKCSDLPCMDISLDLIDEDDYYGVNFSGNKKIYMLFFSGSSDYFSGIWIGNHNVDFLDSMPIYIFDLSASEDIIMEPIGNFRYYIEKLLNDFLQSYKKDDEYTKTALLIKEKIAEFSQSITNRDNYVLDYCK